MPLIVLGVATLGRPVRSPDLAGTWRGVLVTQVLSSPLELVFTRDSSGGWAGRVKLSELPRDATGPIHQVTLTDTSIAIVAEARGLRLELRGAFRDGWLRGTYRAVRSNGRLDFDGPWAVRRTPSEDLSVGMARDTSMFPNRNHQGGVVPAELPPPTGRFAAGRRIEFWIDSTRKEWITEDTSDYRALMVTIWYPGARKPGLVPAAHTPEPSVARDSAGRPRAPADTHVTHGFDNAPVAHTRQPFPVLLFSHGLGSGGWSYTSLLTDLASHGYVVAAIDHTYDNQVTTFPWGRVAWDTPRWQRSFTDPVPPGEPPFTHLRLGVMAKDASFVLTRLEALAADRRDPLRGRLDLKAVGIFGHSLGGIVPSVACREDRRFRACANLDGNSVGAPILFDSSGAGPTQPFLYLTKRFLPGPFQLARSAMTREEYERFETDRRLCANVALARLTGPVFTVSITDAHHISFSDLPFDFANTPETLPLRHRILDTVRGYLRAFFDQTLRGKRNTLFSSPADEPRVVIDRYGSAAGDQPVERPAGCAW